VSEPEICVICSCCIFLMQMLIMQEAIWILYIDNWKCDCDIATVPGSILNHWYKKILLIQVSACLVTMHSQRFV